MSELHTDFVVLGFELHQSPASPDDPVDWASIDLGDQWLALVKTLEFDDGRRALTYLKINSDHVHRYACITRPRNSNFESQKRRLAAHPSFIRLPGASRAIKVTQVVFPELTLVRNTGMFCAC